MASFSPAPPPRRSSRLQNTSQPPPLPSTMQRRGETPLRRRINVPLEDGSSGFATPVRRSHSGIQVSLPQQQQQGYNNSHSQDGSQEGSAPRTGSMGMSMGTGTGGGMDVDEEGKIYGQRDDALFARSEELSVSFYSGLPMEVRQVFKNADVYVDVFTGEIDAPTGFALVASSRTCFVWQHAQTLRTGTLSPTCYIFSCPEVSSTSSQTPQAPPPFHKLVPYGSSVSGAGGVVGKREPGLLLVSVTGQIRFWDSIGIGLAGGEGYTKGDLKLDTEESLTNLIRSDDQTYFASASTGRIFRIILISTGGKHHITSHPFSHPSSSLSLTRFLPSIPSIFSSSSYSSSNTNTNTNSTTAPSSSYYTTTQGSTNTITLDPGYISSLALGARSQAGNVELWALVDTRVQKWDVKPEGWEEPLVDEDVGDVVRSLLRSTMGRRGGGGGGGGVSADDAELDLELLDLKVDDDDKLVILISYAAPDDGTSMAVDLTSPSVRRIYALVTLSLGADTVSAETLRPVPYQSTSSSGAPIHPRIQLVLGGKVVTVQFGDAVALCASDSEYTDRLSLRSASDRTLGVGIVDGDSTLLVLTSATMMRVYVDMERVGGFDSELGRANLIKSTMTQAILYGPNPENPLFFSFPPDVDGEALMSGAQRLSQAILHSDAELVRRNQDLSGQIMARRDRLRWLVRFISDNAALPQMTQKSRQRLATDAEKLFACGMLWDQHSQLLATSPEHSILVDTVLAYMHDTDDQFHEDVIRAFFRFRAQEIGKLLGRVLEQVDLAKRDTARDERSVLVEGNSIVLTALNAAFQFRKENLQLYAISLPMLNPWTSKPEVISVLLGLFELTKRHAESSASSAISSESDTSTQQPVSQLPMLVAVVFLCVNERLEWLASVEDKTAEKEELEARFAVLRPDMLETLRQLGFAQEAFRLAEKYHDFSSLVSLCHKETVYPPHENPNAARIEAYIEQFKYDFAKELYNWCIQHGELRIMFSEEYAANHARFKDWYFAEHRDIKPSLEWISDLEHRRYENTAKVLLRESGVAANLDSKHFMLSLGKLSHLAQMSEQDKGAAVDQSVLDEFHDSLNFVSVHERLIADFQESLSTQKSRSSLEAKVSTVLKAKATRLEKSRCKALIRIFKSLCKDLLDGKVLSVEDTVDVLTLKDNKGSTENYTVALQLLAGTKHLPESRRTAAFYSVWRRILAHDDWPAILRTTNVSDAEVNNRLRQTALYSALSTVLSTLSETTPSEIPPGFDLPSPHVCLTLPSTEVITSRWRGMASDEIESLIADYEVERGLVRDLGVLDGEEDVWGRVRMIARRDLVE